ncbi:hypothetical protein PSTT_04207, partial [Puccinia striiformis]
RDTSNHPPSSHILTSLFLGVILYFLAGQRQIIEKFDRESNKLKNQGFKIISDGIKICANINLSKEDFIQTLLTE